MIASFGFPHPFVDHEFFKFVFLIAVWVLSLLADRLHDEDDVHNKENILTADGYDDAPHAYLLESFTRLSSFRDSELDDHGDNLE